MVYRHKPHDRLTTRGVVATGGSPDIFLPAQALFPAFLKFKQQASRAQLKANEERMAAEPTLKELLEVMVRALVDLPQQVGIAEVAGEQTTVF